MRYNLSPAGFGSNWGFFPVSTQRALVSLPSRHPNQIPEAHWLVLFDTEAQWLYSKAEISPTPLHPHYWHQSRHTYMLFMPNSEFIIQRLQAFFTSCMVWTVNSANFLLLADRHVTWCDLVDVAVAHLLQESTFIEVILHTLVLTTSYFNHYCLLISSEKSLLISGIHKTFFCQLLDISLFWIILCKS